MNQELAVLDKDKMEAICQACDELLDGKLHENFTVDMFQGGAGTSTNMNANQPDIELPKNSKRSLLIFISRRRSLMHSNRFI